MIFDIAVQATDPLDVGPCVVHLGLLEFIRHVTDIFGYGFGVDRVLIENDGRFVLAKERVLTRS